MFEQNNGPKKPNQRVQSLAQRSENEIWSSVPSISKEVLIIKIFRKYFEKL